MKTVRSLTAGLVLLAFAGPAAAQDAPKDLVEYRQAVMSSLGGHAGAIARIMKRQVSYDHVLTHARALATTAPLVDDIWPENSGPDDYEKTEALAKIWEQPDDFQKRVTEMQDAAQAFLAAAENGDQGEVLNAFKELGQSCGDCHDNFRAED